MKIGDLVRYRHTNVIGIVMSIDEPWKGWAEVYWFNCRDSEQYQQTALEVINESR